MNMRETTHSCLTSNVAVGHMKQNAVAVLFFLTDNMEHEYTIEWWLSD